jgi:biopolymer transport protein ExbB
MRDDHGEPKRPAEDEMQGFAKFLHDGGTLMYFNLCTSIIVLSIIVDRLLFFLVKSSVNARAFLENIRKLVLANNLDRAVKLCSATTAPVAQVAKAGLQRVHRGEIAVAQAVEESLVDVTPMLKKRVQILWSLANIATLIGLLGTVLGLIRSFEAVGAPGTKAEDRSRLLANGISEALNNTAMGLGIAVTCIIAHAILSSMSKRQASDLEAFSLKLENLLAESAHSTGGQQK